MTIHRLLALPFFCLCVSPLFAGDQPVLEQAKRTPVIHESVSAFLRSQPMDAPAPVWVYFTDKGVKSMPEFRAALETAEGMMSKRAFQRRAKVMRGNVVAFSDLPVYDAYLAQLQSLGFRQRHISRWLNAVSGIVEQAQLPSLAALPFVRQITLLHSSRRLPEPKDLEQNPEQGPVESYHLQYGRSLTQLEQINVPAVHDLGYAGQNVLICMLDTGYDLRHESLHHIDPVGEHDFIFNDDVTRNEAGQDVSDQHEHGTMTLSVIGGSKADTLYGPAYQAQFILAKTEDIRSETPIEEDNWVAAIEWAEGLGADVASSSLGYYDWYTYEDMNGDTAVTTKAADMAAARGVVVCVAAGNWRQDSWHYISAPADADSIITVGAVNDKGIIASFSSAGPTFDGRIKPEVVAMGVLDWTANPAKGPTEYRYASGTSFSTPLIGGVAALLVQAHPTWTPMQVREALMLTANRAVNPDTLYGWGLVDALKAIQYHQKGDVDGNDQWNSEDALFAAKILLGTSSYTEDEFRAADMNSDGTVDIFDIVKMVRLSANLP